MVVDGYLLDLLHEAGHVAYTSAHPESHSYWNLVHNVESKSPIISGDYSERDSLFKITENDQSVISEPARYLLTFLIGFGIRIMGAIWF